MPAHSDRAGSIILAEAYAASKMLDSSSWNGLLRNHITPSDTDHPEVGICFDNNGAILFCDFSVACSNWDELRQKLRGQRWLYESIIRYSPHCAVLCKHAVRPEARRPIDTLFDVDSFHVMLWDFGIVLSPMWGGSLWRSFVMTWVNNSDGPQRIRRNIIGGNVGLIKPISNGKGENHGQ